MKNDIKEKYQKHFRHGGANFLIHCISVTTSHKLKQKDKGSVASGTRRPGSHISSTVTENCNQEQAQ
jgi:hypothetical protein